MQTNQSIAADFPKPLIPGSQLIASWSRGVARFALLRILEQIEYGSLRLHLPGGESMHFAGSTDEGLQAEINIHDLRALTRLLRDGDIGFAESYLDRQWDSPDLMALMEWASRNEPALNRALLGGRLSRTLNRNYHLSRNNSRQGSRRNIAFHYDMGNDFYRHWLDAGMTYSSALFEHPGQNLEQAQQAKYRRIAELAELKPGSTVLEIGCGWGGFMEHAATHWDSRVLGITLSKEQLRYANERMQAQGLERQSAAVLLDYRDTRGRYDAVVSIEMLEAVGETHWPRYFDSLYRRLKPGACALVQVITIDDQRYPLYRRRADFIQRHIFPGGMLPSLTVLREQAHRAGLVLDQEQTFGPSYAKTLAIWRRRFLAAWPQISALGFDTRFRRLWEYYLCYCETGFRTGSIDVGIYRFRRPG